jgi:hypothetical protein
MKPATAKVIYHKSGQLSIQFLNLSEESVIRAIDKRGDTIENNYGVRFSARNAHLSICAKLSNYILLRPLVSDGKFTQTHDKYNIHQAECVKLAVKEFITVYNSENNDKTVISKPAVPKATPYPIFSTAQEHALGGIISAFKLKSVHENQIRELLNGWDLKQKFEDGVYYVHASGKYRYLGVLQPNKTILLLNLSKGGTVSSLNKDPHHALTAGIVKKEVPF